MCAYTEILTGYLDGPSGWELIGWAWDPVRPDERLRVEIAIDGEPVRRCTASNFRGDLLDARIGDGKHAFSLELPQRVFDGDTHTLSATILPECTDIAGSPRPFQSYYAGALEQIEKGTIRGRLRDEARPAVAVFAEVYGDGHYLGGTSCSGSFELHLPAGFDVSRVQRFELFAHGAKSPAASVEQTLPPPRRFSLRLPRLLARKFDTAVAVPLSEFQKPYEITVRDYSWICPRVNLIDETGRYCGEPTNIAACERCLRRNGPREDWGSLLHDSGSVAEMRAQYRQVLETANLVRFPSEDAADRIRRYAPGIPKAVIAGPPTIVTRSRHRLAPRDFRYVAFAGDPGIREACQWEAAKLGVDIEFVDPGHPGATIALYANTSPDLSARAVEDLIAAGHTEIVAFDIGACASHVHKRLPIQATPRQILDALFHV